MRLATFLVGSRRTVARRPGPPSLPPPPPSSFPQDNTAWVVRRAAAWCAERAVLDGVLRRLADRFDGNPARVARAFALAERSGDVTRRLVSPAMSTEGYARWWLAVGARRVPPAAATSPPRLP